MIQKDYHLVILLEKNYFVAKWYRHRVNILNKINNIKIIELISSA